MTNERTRTTRVSDDRTHIVFVERWLDRQMHPPRWRSKNWTKKLQPNEVEYFRQHDGGPRPGEGV